ncbi:tetratricopeptide repeat protein [Nocardia sp. NBC_01503]|uniref:tetratricopeptide repeat protein n=1 Tax=Nocardia sp. NBC_01503 TaxID=2975997 RepID=UPI002E7AFECE|nr:tetratricopeptide repeat protein [Nocardia sp. NBC_01503]WTL35174.1 tetratricopeptide repeat protein [Nocardia sp. NBC_01503]
MSRNGESEGPDGHGHDVGADTRKQLRGILRRIGLRENELLEPLAAELRQRGCRPRKAWRLANELTQQEVAEEFNRLTGKASAPMKAARISEYEAWPGMRGAGRSRPRPTVDALRLLATIYRTSWDQLVDTADLECMPWTDRAAFRTELARRCTTLPRMAGGAVPGEMVRFVGRERQVAELRQRIERHLEHDGPSVHVVNGLAGIGKTALVRCVVDAHAERYPDGLIWEDLHGHTAGRTPRSAADVLEQLLLKIGVAPETIDGGVERRGHRWRDEIRGHRVLIVFDNALDSQHVLPLLPRARDCLVLITSRRRLTGLAGAAAPLQLDPMTMAEAEEFFLELSHLPTDYDVGAVRRILDTAGRLPLAIRLIAGQIAHGGEDVLTALAAEFDSLAEGLRQAPDDRAGSESVADHILDRFAAEGETLRAAFELSYQRLPDPELRRVVRLLGWFPGPEITAGMLAPMAAVSEPTAGTFIHRISEVGFLDRAKRLPEPSAPTREPRPTGSAGAVRYRIHDVTRLFSRAQADLEDMASERVAAMARLVRHCLGIARAAGVPRPFDIAGSFPTPPPRESDPAAATARDWLTTEREMLLGCIRVAGSSPDSGELARLLGSHLSALGYWSDARWLFVRALDSTRGLGDRLTECDILYELGTVHRRACDYDTAAKCFEEARIIAVQLGDQLRTACALWGYAEVTRHIGDYHPASRAYLGALAIARQLGNPKFEGSNLRGLGHLERTRGAWEIAHDYYLSALGIAGPIGDRYSLGWSLWGLGLITRETGDLDTARAQLVDAHGIAGDISDALLQADTLRGLGQIACDVRDLDAAQEFFADSMDIARRNRDPHGEADALRALAGLVSEVGPEWRVCDFLGKALARYQSMGVKVAEQVRADLQQAVSRCARSQVRIPEQVREDLLALGVELTDSR